MTEQEVRAKIVALAREYARLEIPYVEPCPETRWSVAADEPTAFDCSSLVTRVRLIVQGTYHPVLGDPSATTWAGDVPGQNLDIVDTPAPADLVFYQRSRDSNDFVEPGYERTIYFHVGISDGSGRVVRACDVCGHVTEHPEQCHPERWTLIARPYRRFPT